MADLPFSYEEFVVWHRTHSDRLLAPALAATNNALNAYFDQELHENQRVRVRVAPGRIKNVARTWRKLNLGRYAEHASSLDDVPTVLDDLIATRVICTNTSDLSRVWDLLISLPNWEVGLEPVLALEPDSQRDYCNAPKATGYRARHLNVRTAVNDGLSRTLVTCEVQVRTLLQDSWGELTHEDTYKPGSKTSPLVSTLARRMADLLATLDEIAEDLRGELDVIAVDALEEKAGTANAEEAAVLGTIDVAAAAYLAQRTAELSAPLDLATLAWEMQREFGQEISATWFGHGTFANLVRAANPNVRISTSPPAFVIPDDYKLTDASAASVFEGRLGHLPVLVAFLKGIDRSLPLYTERQWSRVFSTFAEATNGFEVGTTFDVRAINELTRRARDIAAQEADHVARSAFNYVAHGLFHVGDLRAQMTREECEDGFVRALLGRIDDALVVSEEAIADLKSWLGMVRA